MQVDDRYTVDGPSTAQEANTQKKSMGQQHLHRTERERLTQSVFWRCALCTWSPLRTLWHIKKRSPGRFTGMAKKREHDALYIWFPLKTFFRASPIATIIVLGIIARGNGSSEDSSPFAGSKQKPRASRVCLLYEAQCKAGPCLWMLLRARRKRIHEGIIDQEAMRGQTSPSQTEEQSQDTLDENRPSSVQAECEDGMVGSRPEVERDLGDAIAPKKDAATEQANGNANGLPQMSRERPLSIGQAIRTPGVEGSTPARTPRDELFEISNTMQCYGAAGNQCMEGQMRSEQKIAQQLSQIATPEAQAMKEEVRNQYSNASIERLNLCSVTPGATRPLDSGVNSPGAGVPTSDSTACLRKSVVIDLGGNSSSDDGSAEGELSQSGSAPIHSHGSEEKEDHSDPSAKTEQEFSLDFHFARRMHVAQRLYELEAEFGSLLNVPGGRVEMLESWEQPYLLVAQRRGIAYLDPSA